MTERATQSSNMPSRRTTLIVFVIIGLVIVAFLAMLGAWMKKSGVKMLSVGEPVPEFSLTTFSGERYVLSEVLLDRAVLVIIWSSWCPTCDEEATLLQEVWSEAEPLGEVLFLGVDYVDTEGPALDFIAAHGVTYPNGPDLGSAISKLFKIQGVPETFLIGRDGRLKAVKIGSFVSSDEIRTFLANAREETGY